MSPMTYALLLGSECPARHFPSSALALHWSGVRPGGSSDNGPGSHWKALLQPCAFRDPNDPRMSRSGGSGITFCKLDFVRQADIVFSQRLGRRS
jgi:hypothetical protein